MSRAVDLCEQLLPVVQTVFPMARVNFGPDQALENVSDMEVSITPESVSAQYLTRGTPNVEATAGVVVVKHVATMDEVPGLLAQMETLFDATQFLQLPIGMVTAFRNYPIYDLDILRNDRVFLSVVDVTVRCR